MAETSGSGVLPIKTLNIASDVNATAKRYSRFGQDCASRLRFPLGACFSNYYMHKLDFRHFKAKPLFFLVAAVKFVVDVLP